MTTENTDYVKIRRNLDNKTKLILFPIETATNWFLWAEGNYSCDCNRKIFFDDKGYQEVDCSDGLYSVQLPNSEEWL